MSWPFVCNRCASSQQKQWASLLRPPCWEILQLYASVWVFHTHHDWHSIDCLKCFQKTVLFISRAFYEPFNIIIYLWGVFFLDVCASGLKFWFFHLVMVFLIFKLSFLTAVDVLFNKPSFVFNDMHYIFIHWFTQCSLTSLLSMQSGN